MLLLGQALRYCPRINLYGNGGAPGTFRDKPFSAALDANLNQVAVSGRKGGYFAVKYAGLQSGNVSLCNFGIVGCTVFGLWRLEAGR